MRLGIMSAMDEENRRLVGVLEGEVRVSERARRQYHQGRLGDFDVVLTFSHWGKVAAAASATQLIAAYDVDAVVFTGVAGGIDAGLNLGDIVVADSLVQHDLDPRPIFDRFEIPMLGRKELIPDSRLSKTLVDAASSYLLDELTDHVSAGDRERFGVKAPKVHTGLIASGDRFVADHDSVRELREALPGISCVEMEGAAVAQVCSDYGIPFAVVRTISDSADDEAPINFLGFIEDVASLYSLGIIRRFVSMLERQRQLPSG